MLGSGFVGVSRSVRVDQIAQELAHFVRDVLFVASEEVLDRDRESSLLVILIESPSVDEEIVHRVRGDHSRSVFAVVGVRTDHAPRNAIRQDEGVDLDVAVAENDIIGLPRSRRERAGDALVLDGGELEGVTARGTGERGSGVVHACSIPMLHHRSSTLTHKSFFLFLSDFLLW